MQLNKSHWSVTAVASALLITALPAAAAPPQDEIEERRIVVDVAEGGLPRVWTSLSGGYLGINMVELTPELRSHFGVSEDTGVMISQIAGESPAATVGLQVGDILTSIDGASVSGSRDVVRGIGAKKKGDSVTLEVFRDGAYMTLEATLDERERPQIWLNRFGDEEHSGFEFHTGEGENVFFLPGPDSGVHIRRERMDELMGDLHERLASPEFEGRMLEVRSNTAELEARIKELEKRLQELAEKLEKADG